MRAPQKAGRLERGGRRRLRKFYHRLSLLLPPLLLLGSVLYLALRWSSLPERVPTNYSFTGEVTGYGSRATVWLMPCAGLVIYLTLLFASLRPQSWNLGFRVPAEKMGAVYRVTGDLLADLRLCLTGCFVLLSLTVLHPAPPLLLAVLLPALTLLPLLRYGLQIFWILKE